MAVVLASQSPRRRELLGLLVHDFSCHPVDIDETPRGGEAAADYVLRLAVEKARACDRSGIVVAADTTVSLDGGILGKPVDRDDARGMLRALSAREHSVMTAVAVVGSGRLSSRLVTTVVEFAPLDDALITRYLASAEPWDKAGAYGIQGFAGSFVRRLTGSYSAVVGLPLAETRELLADHGVLPDWSVAVDA